MNDIPDDTAPRESPVALVSHASEALADVCASLAPERGWLGESDRFSISREVELIARRAEVAAVLHAGHFASVEVALNRSRTRIAAALSEATGCSRPQAHTRLDTFDLVDTIAGRAFIELRITAIQARAIASAREPYEDLLDKAVLDRAEERIVRRAGTKSAATLKQEVQTSLSPRLPSDGKDRQAQQRAARAARLYGQQSDGMSKLVLNVTPGTRSLLGGLSARASALRAKQAEEAPKRAGFRRISATSRRSTIFSSSTSPPPTIHPTQPKRHKARAPQKTLRDRLPTRRPAPRRSLRSSSASARETGPISALSCRRIPARSCPCATPSTWLRAAPAIYPREFPAASDCSGSTRSIPTPRTPSPDSPTRSNAWCFTPKPMAAASPVATNLRCGARYTT